MLSRSLEVGDRVSLGGRHKATVKYVGRIEGQEGEWAGLEWHDPSRGKHGGGHEGRRYFDCAPGAGSFVRLPKLLATADAGRGVGEAVAERYTPGAAQGEEGGAGEMYVPTASQRRVQVELVGAAAAAAALAVDGNLRQASLVDMRVSRVVRKRGGLMSQCFVPGLWGRRPWSAGAGHTADQLSAPWFRG
jgi:hypothetical protein